MAPVLVITPAQVVFQDVKPGEVRSQYVSIHNPLTSPVGFTIKPSAARYRLEPDEGRIELRPGGVLQVLVELHMPPKSTRTGAKESYKDLLHIKSNYFDQKVKILVNPSPDGASPRPSPYSSPNRARSATTSPHRSPARPRRQLFDQGGGGGAGSSQEPRARSPFRAVDPAAPPPGMPTPWEGAGAVLEELHDLPSEVRLVMEEEGRRLRRTLTREFNDKCERYMQLFAAKDDLLREKDGLLLEKEHALEAAEASLVKARNRVRELEGKVKGQEEERARWVREREGEKEQSSRQWAEREAKWRLEQTERDEKLRALQAEVEERRQQQAEHEEKEGQWRLEQTDLRERLVALQGQLEAATQARADSEGTQAQWQRREAELEKSVRQLQAEVTELHARHEEKEGQWRLEQADMGENLGRLEGEKAEVLRKNGQLRTALADAEAAHAEDVARLEQEKAELQRKNGQLRKALDEAEAADVAGRLVRLEGERETLLRANEALRATLAQAQADDMSEVVARLEGEAERLSRMNDRLRTSLSKAEADATLAMRERDDALLLLSEASSTKPDMGREAPPAQGPTNPESRRPSLADQGLPPPAAPASAEPRQEGDGTEDLLLRLLKDKVTDQKEQIDVLVSELDRVHASQQQPSADAGDTTGGADVASTAAREKEVATLREALARSEALLHAAQSSLQQVQEERQQLQRRVRSLEHMQATARELLLHQTSAGGGLDRSKGRRHRSSSPQPRHRTHAPSFSSDGDEEPTTSDKARWDPFNPGWAEAQGWWVSLVQHEQQGDREQGDEEDEEEALRDAGVEIARLRQELLAKDMEVREAARSCDERIRAADRRMLRLEQAVRSAREENKLKVHELETSVRVLSGRGDLHRALACVRQELAQQRVQTMQLQGEVELHRRLTQEAADHASSADARTADMQALLDCQQVQLSLHKVPGVSRPLTLIQHFAGLMAAGCATIQELRHRMTSTLGKKGRARRTAVEGRRRSELKAETRPAALPAQDERPQEKDGAEETEARLPPPSAAREEAAARGRERPTPAAPREVSEVYVSFADANAAGEEDREEEEEEDEVALSQRFTDRMERAQLAARRERAEEELSTVKEEALRLRLEMEGLREQGKREAAALEEAQRSVTTALQRRVTVAEEERRRAEEKASGWRDRVLVLEEELMAERALGGVREEKGQEEGDEEEDGAGERERKGREEEDGRRRGRRRGIDGVLGLGGAEAEEEEQGGEEETKRLASMLQEKTAQVSVLMESVEALQGAVLASREVEREEAGLLSGNWAVSKLVKRVASLTMDLSHAQAMQAMAERRAERLSREGEGREREGVERERAIEAAQEKARRATARAAAVAEEYARVSRSRDEEARRMEAQIEALERRLLESESSLLSTTEHRTELQERLHHLEAILATGHPTLPSAQRPWSELDTSDGEPSCDVTWQPPADAFCHACGALTFPPHTRPASDPPTPADPTVDEDLTPPPKDKASYQALLQSMLGQMEAWHGEAMAAALAHPLRQNPDGGSTGSSPPPPPTFLEFFMDTVADLMADADSHYVRVLHRARELEWKLRTTRLQLLHEAKGRQAAGHRAKALDQTLVAYREALIRRKWHEESSSAALSDVGMDPVWLTQRWRQQCETLRHLDSRVAWLEGERQRLTKEAAVEKEARKREARRAEEVEAREREKEAEERGLARQELDEVVLPRLEERVRHWCEHEMPLLLCGPAKPVPQGNTPHPPRLEKDTLALVEALCVSKAVIAALETRLEAALCDLDRCRQESRDLATALHNLLSSHTPQDTQPPPPPSEDNSDLPLTTLPPPPTLRLRQRLMELEEQVCQVREARDRADRLLRTLAAENEALRATAEVHRTEGEEEEDREQEVSLLKRELARMATEAQKAKDREEELKKRVVETAEHGGAAASVRPTGLAFGARPGQEGASAFSQISSATLGAAAHGPLPPPPEQAEQNVAPPQPPAPSSTGAGAGSNDPEVLTRQLVRLEAQCRLLEEEVLTKDAGLRALHQSLLSVTATSLLQQGRHEDATEVARLVEELMDSRMGEARALRRLSLACEAEASLRQHITTLQEALHPTDDAPARQANRLQTTLLFGAYGQQGEDGRTGLEEQVKRQAGIIAYLEMRLAQATAAEAAIELQHIHTREGQMEEEEEKGTGRRTENRGHAGLLSLEDTMSDPPARPQRQSSQARGQRSPSVSPPSSPPRGAAKPSHPKAPRSPARPEGRSKKSPTKTTGKGNRAFADSMDTLGPMPRRQAATGGGGSGLADSMDTLGPMPRRQGATGGGARRPVASAPSTSTHPTLDTSTLTARIAGLENEAEALQTRLREAERERQKADRERQKADRERQKAEEDRDAEAQARGALEEQSRKEGEERRALEARVLAMERRLSEASHRRPSTTTYTATVLREGEAVETAPSTTIVVREGRRTSELPTPQGQSDRRASDASQCRPSTARVAQEGQALEPPSPAMPDVPSTGTHVPTPQGQSERRSSDASQRRPSVVRILEPEAEGPSLPQVPLSDIPEGGPVEPSPDSQDDPVAVGSTDDAGPTLARVIARRESGVQTDLALPLDAPEQLPTTADGMSVAPVDGPDGPPVSLPFVATSAEEGARDVTSTPTEVGAPAVAPSALPTFAQPSQVGGGGPEEAGDGEEKQQAPSSVQPQQGQVLPSREQDLAMHQAYVDFEAEKARMTQKLSELRTQVSELYRQAQAKEQGLREQWETDKAALETQVLTLRHELLSARTAHAQALQTQRDAYDEAIREMEETAAARQRQQQEQQQQQVVSDEEVAALRAEVERLRDQVQQLEASAKVAQEAAKREEEGRRKGRGGPSALSLLHGQEEEETQAAQEALKELALVRAQLEEAEARLQVEVERGREAVTSVSTAFRAFREKQAAIVHTLEARLREARRLLEQAKKGRKATIADTPKRVGPNTTGAGGGVALPGHGPPKPASDFRVSEENEELLEVLAERERQLAEADNRLRRLHADLRTAEAERDRVIEVAIGGGGVGADRQRDAVVRAALLEAKLAVNTQVMEQLCREVEEERGAGNEVRRELAARVLQMATIRRLRAGPSTQSLTKQVAELKRASKTETTRLKAIIKKLQGQVPEGEKYEEMKAEVATLRQWQTSTREDLARKAKLLSSLKSTRAADESALARWKAEVATLEQRVRSLNKDLYRKDVAIRELRGRVSEQEQQEEALAGGVNAPTLVYPDARLKTIVAERDRLKMRCATLEKKVGEQAKALQEATQRLKQLEDGEGKVASLRAAVQRKDSLLKASKAKILVYAQELSGLKAAAYQWQNEAERHLKQLQKRSMQAARYPPVEPLGGEAPPLEEMRMQLRSLARADATGVRSLVLNVLAMMHEDGEEAAGGGAVLLGDDAGARAEQEPRPRRVVREEGGEEEEEVEEEDKVQGLMDSIDHILAQPNAADSGRRLAALVDGFMEATSVGGGYV